MKQIYSSSLQTIYYDKDKSIIKNVWSSIDYTFEDMKREMHVWMEKFNETKPKYMLTDSSSGIVVPVDIQDWIVSFLFPTVIEKGALKYAIIMSKELVAELSVEQMFNEVRDKPTGEFQQFNFENEAEAIKWLLRK